MAHLLPPAGITTHKDEAFMIGGVKTSNFFKRAESRIPPNIHDYKWTDYDKINRICMAQLDAIEDEARSKNVHRVTRSKFNSVAPCPSTVKEQWRIPPCACPKHRGVGGKGGKGCFCADRYSEDPGYNDARHGNRGWSYGERKNGPGPRGGAPAPGNVSSRGGGYGDGLGVHGNAWMSPTSGPYGDTATPHHHPGEFPDGWGYCPPAGLDPRCLVRPRDENVHASVRPTGDPYFAQESRKSCLASFQVPRVQKGVFTFDDWQRTEKDREPPEALRGMCIPSLACYCGPVYEDCYSQTAYLTQLHREPWEYC